MGNAAREISAIVFDLDGTLYVSEGLAADIQDGATSYMADLKGVPPEEMARIMAATRTRLTDETGIVQTLSTVCTALGGDIRALHAWFQEHLLPEKHLQRDQRVVDLLDRLHQRYGLYIYTNNNHALTTRIIHNLGLDGLFAGCFAIDDTWQAKPHQDRLEQILEIIGRPPARVLFVGDRYDVDLRLPEQKGCPIFLCQTVEQLLRLEQLLLGPAQHR